MNSARHYQPFFSSLDTIWIRGTCVCYRSPHLFREAGRFIAVCEVMPSSCWSLVMVHDIIWTAPHRLIIMRFLFTFSICIILLVSVASTTTDHYKTLDLPRDATQSQIKKAYRALSLKYHPDKNSEEDASTKFIQVGEAYETLGDPEKRKTYDQWLNSPRRGPSQTPPRQPPPRRPSNDNKDHYEKTESFTGPDGKTTTRTYRSSSNDPKASKSHEEAMKRHEELLKKHREMFKRHHASFEK
ncbi:dnaJ [Planoprotostelium fungivorum]|uniref:DnaJ n=1 Tax=Planoprotostelium fungivorum TaxID=1890364 RepID=A0A2P6P086_9EUKA|nr:dnaJ [Planoprotostelium fungivorum]